MNPTRSEARSIPAILWAAVMGGTGFAAGFLGPLVLTPEANQGPLLGIFITGPLGVLLGLVLFGVTRGLRLTAKRQWQVLKTFAVVIVAATLYVCLPGPALHGEIVDAEVQRCGPPSERVDRAVGNWEKRIAKVTWSPARSGWQAYARRSAQEDNGAVVGVLVLRRNTLYEQRKPWNKGDITARGWKDVNKRQSYYVPDPVGLCADYPAGKRLVRFVSYDVSVLNRHAVEWPPTKLSDFLDLQVLGPVREEHRKFAEN
jgi:hypothetical protein